MATVADTSTGVYILQDDPGGWVATGNPNVCVIGGAGLTLGEGYIYFADFESVAVIKDSSGATGYNTWTVTQDYAATQGTRATCMEGIVTMIQLNVVMDSTEAQNMSKIYDYMNDDGSSQYYFVRQWASTTFCQFSYKKTLKNYLPVIVTNYTQAEDNTTGKFILNGQITMQVAELQT
jgi:hypothetical protein